MNLFFDVETTGLDYKSCYIVQLAWIIGEQEKNALIRQIRGGKEILVGGTHIHGHTKEKLLEEGRDIREVLDEFESDLDKAEFIICHNYEFDASFVSQEGDRLQKSLYDKLDTEKGICTMKSTKELVGITNYYGFKYPKLQELHYTLFDSYFDNAHDALADVKATKKCYEELVKRNFNFEAI